MQLQRVTSESGESPGLISANLPPQILDQVAGRLCWISGFVACSVVLLGSSQALLQDEFGAALQRPLLRLTLLGLLFLTVGFIVVQRNGWLSKARLLDFGLVYQVLVGFVLCLIETAVDWNPEIPMRGLPAVTAWLLLCGLLLPNAPLKVGIAAVFSVASWPLAYWINLKLYGFQPLPWHRLAVWIGPLIITGIAMYLINRRTISMKVRAQRAEQLGSYQLDYRIGRGGMGEVWRARHKMLARDAAVKLIRPEILHASSGRQEAMLLKRFEREAQATAQLRSPNTVALYDFGQSRDGTIYYVMELLDGFDLQTLVDRFGTMPAGRVINVLIQVCESLEEAHRAGLVHRDIKPKNILLCRLGLQHDFVKVLDFGLVKMQQKDQPAITMDGFAAGTPAYLPPEIGLGQETIDGRSDLYSLGCVAYFMLTGHLVFEESSAVAQAIAHVQKTPLPPSQRTELPVPPSLEAVVLKLLEKQPEDRYQSAYDLGRALRAIKDVPQFCPYTAAEWWQTNMPEMSIRPLDEEKPDSSGEMTASNSGSGVRIGAVTQT